MKFFSINKVVLKRILISIFTTIAILGTASSCSVPGFLGGNQSTVTYGVLKKDPAVRADGFVRANAVKQLNGQTDNQGLGQLSVTKISRISKETLYILTKEKGIFKSTDGGAVWERKYILPISSSNSDNNARQREINQKVVQNDNLIVVDFAIEPSQPSLIYASVLENNLGKIYQSLDGGDTFKEVYSEVETEISVQFLAIDPLNTVNVFAVLQEGALLRSLDSGNTWQKIRSFQDTPVQIGFAPEFNKIFFALFENQGLAISPDLGATWNLQNFQKAPSEIGENQPKDGLDLSFGGNAKFGKYEKAIPVVSSITLNRATGVINNPSGKQPWILVADRQIWVSQDLGRDFKKLVLPLQSETANIYDVTFDPNVGLNRILVSIDNRLFITLNQGSSWNTQDNINLSTPIGNISQILIERENPEIVYLGIVNRRGTRNGGLFSL